MGNCSFWKGNKKEARLYYTLGLKATSSSTQKAILYNNIGTTYYHEKHYQNALFYYQKSNNLAPQLLTPQFNLIELYLQFGLREKAGGHLSTLLSKKSSDFELKKAQANYELIGHRLPQTLKLFAQFSPDDLKKREIANYYAFALYLNGNRDEAKQILAETEQSNREEINLHYRDIYTLINQSH